MLSQVKHVVNASLGRFGYRIERIPTSGPNFGSSSLKKLKAESVDGWFSEARPSRSVLPNRNDDRPHP
jgi:hypothetical protein